MFAAVLSASSICITGEIAFLSGWTYIFGQKVGIGCCTLREESETEKFTWRIVSSSGWASLVERRRSERSCFAVLLFCSSLFSFCEEQNACDLLLFVFLLPLVSFATFSVSSFYSPFALAFCSYETFLHGTDFKVLFFWVCKDIFFCRSCLILKV